jgi:hypothetical protein
VKLLAGFEVLDTETMLRRRRCPIHPQRYKDVSGVKTASHQDQERR